MQKLFEQKLAEQQTNYQSNIQQCEHDYEKKLQSLKHDLKQFNEKYQVLAQHHEQAQNELKQRNQEVKQYNETCTQQRELIEKSEKAFVQIKADLEKKFHEKVSFRFFPWPWIFSPITSIDSYSHQIQEINDKARQNEQQLMDNMNREHAKMCEKLKLEYEQGKDQ